MVDGANNGSEAMKRARNSSLKVVAAVLALAAMVAAGCKQKAAPGSVDFARSNSVSVVLGDPDAEHGNGIEHVYWEKDGLTTATHLDGGPCRRLKLGEAALGYIYFSLDPAFKKGGINKVKIEVEYFDGNPGEMGLQFDASKSRGVARSAYTESGQIVELRARQTWETAKFYIQDAAFRNGQNSHSDFRLWIKSPEIHVRKVTVSRIRR